MRAALRLSLILGGLIGMVATASAQTPADLLSAMRARDSAFFNADAAAWSRFTADSFTTVQQDGSMMTRPQRLAHLRRQTPRPFVSPSREQVHGYGPIYVRRFRSADLWVLEVWAQEHGAWRSVASQVTTANKE